MAAVVGIVSGCDLSIYTRCEKLVLYKPLLHCNNHLKQLQLANKMERFSFEGGRG